MQAVLIVVSATVGLVQVRSAHAQTGVLGPDDTTFTFANVEVVSVDRAAGTVVVQAPGGGATRQIAVLPGIPGFVNLAAGDRIIVGLQGQRGTGVERIASIQFTTAPSSSSSTAGVGGPGSLLRTDVSAQVVAVDPDARTLTVRLQGMGDRILQVAPSAGDLDQVSRGDRVLLTIQDDLSTTQDLVTGIRQAAAPTGRVPARTGTGIGSVTAPPRGTAPPVGSPQQQPTPTPTPTPTPSATPTPSPTASPTATPSPSPTASPSPVPSPTVSPTPPVATPGQGGATPSPSVRQIRPEPRGVRSLGSTPSSSGGASGAPGLRSGTLGAPAAGLPPVNSAGEPGASAGSATGAQQQQPGGAVAAPQAGVVPTQPAAPVAPAAPQVLVGTPVQVAPGAAVTSPTAPVRVAPSGALVGGGIFGTGPGIAATGTPTPNVVTAPAATAGPGIAPAGTAAGVAGATGAATAATGAVVPGVATTGTAVVGGAAAGGFGGAPPEGIGLSAGIFTTLPVSPVSAPLVAEATSATVPAAPGAAAEPDALARADLRSQMGARDLSARLATFAQRADEIDRLWMRYRVACDVEVGPTSQTPRGWFVLWEGGGTPVNTVDSCDVYYDEIVRHGEALKVQVSAAEDAARSAGVMPGTIRELFAAYSLDWGGWDLPRPAPRRR